MRTKLSRREAATLGLSLAFGATYPCAEATSGKGKRMIQTVLGPIAPEKFGFVVPHEHVLCDFIGAEETNRSRWKQEEVVAAILPNLKQLKERGVTGFADCTPAYIGRDPRILKTLAQKTKLHILTNTGYYGGAGDKFLPKHAFTETEGQLAERWLKEWRDGIEDTGIKPGFIKIGVDEATGDPPRLSEADAKLVRAAAQVSRQTNLAVTCHTGGGEAGLAAARLFAAEGGVPAKFIVAHSDGHGHEINFQVAQLGSFVSYDAVGWRPTEEHVRLILPMLEKYADRLFLSMDSGWYFAGEPNGGKIRPYNYLTDDCLPALRKAGVADAVIRKVTVENPKTAFTIELPSG